MSDNLERGLRLALCQVASQCLQSAYALNVEDKHLEVSKTLETIFQVATQHEPVSGRVGHKNIKPFLQILSAA